MKRLKRAITAATVSVGMAATIPCEPIVSPERILCKCLRGVKFLTKENEPKRPLTEILDDAIKKAVQDARLEDRSVDQKQYLVLRQVCDTLTGLIGGEPQITLHPAFSAGYVTVKVSDIRLSADEISDLRMTLERCTALSIEPLANGNIEIGVTVPDVFCQEPKTE